jgi:hypothetical protein
MSIEEKIAAIAAGDEFAQYTYIFDNLYRIDERVNTSVLPALLCTLPRDGVIEIRNGRVYDTETIKLGFVDIIPHDANGEDNAEVYNRMKALGIQFIMAMRKSGMFGQVTTLGYTVEVAQFSNIVTGVFFDIQVQDIGRCD